MKCHKYKIHDWVTVNEYCEKDIRDLIGKKSLIVELHMGSIYDYVILTEGKETKVKEFEIEPISLLEKEFDTVDNKNSYFEDLGLKTGQLVDEKQKAYGDSVGKTFELMKIYLQNWRNEDGTYTIPESLLKHILLQVRIIDKQNRIFNNPEGDLMQENPYLDKLGYSMLGVRMCESNSQQHN